MRDRTPPAFVKHTFRYPQIYNQTIDNNKTFHCGFAPTGCFARGGAAKYPKGEGGGGAEKFPSKQVRIHKQKPEPFSSD